ncbi:hypothetical protein FNH22_11030 [Fulvivirga sp. M361]|uniref:hypothetical protein n=1 Tax=Fulvivirga sp. M361 TaxID=2594266 RepID=UPI00117BC278|nr:hypothetical protein [Fulvivirga sp. M361]TRX59053.1 hypothetical protein FNH22_11030 [Fulvivirga sp. M361]
MVWILTIEACKFLKNTLKFALLEKLQTEAYVSAKLSYRNKDRVQVAQNLKKDNFARSVKIGFFYAVSGIINQCQSGQTNKV